MRLFKVFNRFTIDLSPPTVLALGFLIFICIGTILLKMPFATVQPVSWIDAWFTAASAVTITGLTTIDVGTVYSTGGQLVVAALMQLGGLGFMTFAVIAAISLRPKMGLGQQVVAQEALGQTGLGKVVRVARAVFIYSVFFEFIGFILLTFTWQSRFGWQDSAYYAFFHSISAFNNAGITLFPDSMMGFTGEVATNLIISGLFIIGGIGFVVLLDIKDNWRWKKLQPNTRIILLASLGINVIAFALIWLLEANNPATLGHLSTGDQITTAWFQATVPRSSGFAVIPVDQMKEASSILTMLLMFIGGGSLSTAGGIKIGTFVVLIAATYAFLRRQDEVRILKRSIDPQIVMKALALTIITMMLIFLGIFIIAAIEQDVDFFDLSFEVISAVCTVGLSRGLTGELSDVSKFLLTFMMFTGRLGPLTLAYFIATPIKSHLKYPTTHIPIG